MEHIIKLSDKKITLHLHSEKECKMADFYFTDFDYYLDTETHIEFIIAGLKEAKNIYRTITTTEYLNLRAALVDIVAQFYY